MPSPPPLKRILLSALIALAIGLVAIVIAQGGMSGSMPLNLLEGLAILGLGFFVFSLMVQFIVGRMAHYTDPETDAEFEELVEFSEHLAREGLAAEPLESEFMQLDPLDDEDFMELVKDALDDLPDLLRRLVDNHNVAVVISDGGRRHRAYGLYRGDGASRDGVADQIIIFRDTLRRDFGHDPELLREQVTITVRHELAHHVGFDELGVRGLGL
jgi:predicted Zn-dependent protease with MMP-like domain